LAIFAPISFLLAALLFVILAILLATGWRRRLQSGLLILAVLVSAGWAGAFFLQTLRPLFTSEFLFLTDMLRYLAWFVFIISIVKHADNTILSPTLRWSAYLVPAALIAVGLLPLGVVEGPDSILVSGSIVVCLIGLALTERVYGSSDPAVRRPIVYLAIAMIGIFGFDLVLYSSAVLTEGIEPGFWAARGFANALIVPFIAVAARRNRDWPVDMFVSRQVAYFSMTLFGAGVYLVLMAIGGYYVKEFGGDWGTALATILVFGAIILLVSVLLSDRLRRKAKVFLSKHFFRNRYDYRDEWRKLTKALYHADESRSLEERSIEAVARIFHSRSGFLLLRDENENYVPVAWWHCDEPESAFFEENHELIRFLREKEWVIDTREYIDNPKAYQGLKIPEWLSQSEFQRLAVPLLQESALIGVLVLEQEHPIKLTYEDTDLLKIVGRQVAGLIDLQLKSMKLAEGRQFQAYSRLAAFMMHDLKNVAAQQSLVVKNAAKHKDNPEFIDDAFQTIEHSVQRVNRLIQQLSERSRKERREKVDLADVLRAVVEQTSDRDPVPIADIESARLKIFADRDRLFAVFYHVLRNAQDACNKDGAVEVSLLSSKGLAVIEITDNGSGMSERFIREQLFKPFESTKGADGMGIGAYQVREYVRELNGYLEIDSALGEGTTITIRLPLAVDDRQEAANA
jgi:putative PEP-CTERM system histidine kinase